MDGAGDCFNTKTFDNPPKLGRRKNEQFSCFNTKTFDNPPKLRDRTLSQAVVLIPRHLITLQSEIHPGVKLYLVLILRHLITLQSVKASIPNLQNSRF